MPYIYGILAQFERDCWYWVEGGGYAVNKHFCLHNNLPTVLCPIFMEYRSNVLNAIADILNSRIFENEIEKTAMRKPFVCSPEEIAKEITIVKTICLYIDPMLIFLGPHSNLLLLIWNLWRPYIDPHWAFYKLIFYKKLGKNHHFSHHYRLVWRAWLELAECDCTRILISFLWMTRNRNFFKKNQFFFSAYYYN